MEKREQKESVDLKTLEELKQKINAIIIEETDLIRKIVISNKVNSEYRKIEIKPVHLKGLEQYQMSCYTEKQVFQKNFLKEDLVNEILEFLPKQFCQLLFQTAEFEYGFKVTKKGKILSNKNKIKTVSSIINRREIETDKNAQSKNIIPAFSVDYEHNRKKNYILEEGTVIPPLVDMGIFTKEGKVVRTMYDKFKQINRFIELVDDVLKDEKKEEINIIDFGCGKSYLTFILYYYLVELKKKKANIVGLDLKADVIKKCNETAKKYGYDNLKFELGDINGYKNERPVDMVVTLHACDTATDYALFNAVSWNAKYIMSVPCCQHELNKTIDSDALAPMMKYGIIKERMAALATDAIRGNMLEYRGYKTQLLEFVDLAHSPKNILIRAVKTNISDSKREKALQEVEDMCEMLSVEPSIYKLLK